MVAQHYVASSQPLWWHNTNGGKGLLCMHVLRVCLVCGKGMVWEMSSHSGCYQKPMEICLGG